MSWMQTFTGKKFYPLSPDRRLLDIRDIAHSLSLQCRYAGHVRRFYSVAEHSVRVSQSMGDDWVNACWGLIHDASEAYLTDIPRPLKLSGMMTAYLDAEKRLQAEIALWLGLPVTEPERVKVADVEILSIEAPELLGELLPEWASTTATGDLPKVQNNRFGVRGCLGWGPEYAEKAFLAQFDRLFGDRQLYVSPLVRAE